MAGQSLTTASVLQCPHGGSVQIISSNTRVKAESMPVATSADTFMIVGCPFQIPAGPAPIPSPCVQVIWQMPDTRVKVNSTFTLSMSSVGMCMSAAGIPQGPVMIVNSQARAKSQ
jgi:hypothetical protein